MTMTMTMTMKVKIMLQWLLVNQTNWTELRSPDPTSRK